MLRFVFFLITIFIAWVFLDMILRGIQSVFGGRRLRRREPTDNRKTAARPQVSIEPRDVKDAEFKDIPPDDRKSAP